MKRNKQKKTNARQRVMSNLKTGYKPTSKYARKQEQQPEDQQQEEKTYRLLSAPLIHTPGLVRAAQHEHKCGIKPKDNGILNALKAGFNTVPESAWLKMLEGNCKIYEQEGTVLI